MRPLTDIPSGGRWPRHIAVDDRWLYIANERSDDLVALHLDDTKQRAWLQTPNPSFVLPIPPASVDKRQDSVGRSHREHRDDQRTCAMRPAGKDSCT
jgi:hypothetical protein